MLWVSEWEECVVQKRSCLGLDASSVVVRWLSIAFSYLQSTSRKNTQQKRAQWMADAKQRFWLYEAWPWGYFYPLQILHTNEFTHGVWILKKMKIVWRYFLEASKQKVIGNLKIRLPSEAQQSLLSSLNFWKPRLGITTCSDKQILRS